MANPPSPFVGDHDGGAASGDAPDGAGFPPKFAKEGRTFDDVLLLPAESNVLPHEVSTAAQITPRIALNIPIVSRSEENTSELQSIMRISYADSCLKKTTHTLTPHTK